jgi:hypothetical protein
LEIFKVPVKPKGNLKTCMSSETTCMDHGKMQRKGKLEMEQYLESWEMTCKVSKTEN